MSPLALNAQFKMGGVKGDFKVLKDVETVSVEFDFDGMTIGEFKDGNEYIAKKVSEKNEDEAGDGDRWKEKFVGSRDRVYAPKFVELFNKHADGEIYMRQSAEDAEYKIIVKTVFTEPGWNAVVMRKKCRLNLLVSLINISSGEEIASLKMDKVPGGDVMGYDINPWDRIKEGYAKSGKELAKFFIKKGFI